MKRLATGAGQRPFVLRRGGHRATRQGPYTPDVWTGTKGGRRLLIRIVTAYFIKDRNGAGLTMLNEDFAYLIKKFGKPKGGSLLDPDIAKAYRGKLPDSLIDFWLEVGIGSWLKGRFQFCRPEDYADIVSTIFKGDPDIDPDRTYIYGYSAFGILFVWNKDHFRIEVDLPELSGGGGLLGPNSEERRAVSNKLGPDRVLPGGLSLLDMEAYAGTDSDGKLLFARALKQLGELKFGECYGFVPALAFGGEAKLENLKRVSALEHFSFLAQLDRVRLIEYLSTRPVRYFGPQS